MDILKIKAELGLRIKSFRNEKKYTQEEFSSLIGLNQANLSNIENGKTFPDVTTLCSMIYKADIEPNYLLGFLRKENKIYSTLDFEIASLLSNLPTDSKKHIKELILSLQK